MNDPVVEQAIDLSPSESDGVQKWLAGLPLKRWFLLPLSEEQERLFHLRKPLPLRPAESESENLLYGDHS